MTRALPVVLVAGALTTFLAACSGGGPAGTTTASTTGSGAGGTTGTGTGGSTGGASSTGGTGLPYQGFLILSSESLSGTKVYGGQAGFYPTTAFSACAGGTLTDGCCYQSAAAAEAAGAGLPAPNVSAGALTLLDGSATLATLPFTAGTGYTPTNSITFAAGDTLGVTAAGDSSGVAAFSGTVAAPSALADATPAIATLSTISRSTDFNLTWTAGGSATVTLNLTAVHGTAADGLIRCTAPKDGGVLDVPSALLSNFQSGDSVAVEVSVANNTTLTAQNATIELSAETLVLGSVVAQ